MVFIDFTKKKRFFLIFLGKTPVFTRFFTDMPKPEKPIG